MRIEMLEKEKVFLNGLIPILRNERNFKQSVFKMVCSRSTLSKIEKNQITTKEEIYEDILEVLGERFCYEHSCFDEAFICKLKELYKAIEYLREDEIVECLNDLKTELKQYEEYIIEKWFIKIIFLLEKKYVRHEEIRLNEIQTLAELLPKLPLILHCIIKVILFVGLWIYYSERQDLSLMSNPIEKYHIFDDLDSLLREEYINYCISQSHILGAYSQCTENKKYFEDTQNWNRLANTYRVQILISYNAYSENLDRLIEDAVNFCGKYKNKISLFCQMSIMRQIAIVYFIKQDWNNALEYYHSYNHTILNDILPTRININCCLEKLGRYDEFEYDEFDKTIFAEKLVIIYDYFKLKHSYLIKNKAIDYEVLADYIVQHRNYFEIKEYGIFTKLLKAEITQIITQTKRYWLNDLIKV